MKDFSETGGDHNLFPLLREKPPWVSTYSVHCLKIKDLMNGQELTKSLFSLTKSLF